MGSDNGVVTIRGQAPIWTDDGLGYWPTYVSLSVVELNGYVPCLDKFQSGDFI